MPRLPRINTLGPANHVIGRAVGHLDLFLESEDFQFYLRLLDKAMLEGGFHLYDYALMNNHFHLVISEPRSQEIYSRAMKRLLHVYSLYHRERYSRLGSLWQPRFKNYPITNDSYLLTCCAYVELNPVRAGMVNEPGRYPWSAAKHYLCGANDSLITHHPSYLGLGETDQQRQKAFAEIVGQWQRRPSSKDVARRLFQSHQNQVIPKVSDT
jgi:putative transposase